MVLASLKKGNTPVMIKKMKCTSNDRQYICEQLYKKLNDIKELLNVDHVIIENQPVYTNPTMKHIGSILFGYFISKGIIEKETTGSTITDVKFISAANKLKISEEDNKLLETMMAEKDGKKKNKLNNKLNNKLKNKLKVNTQVDENDDENDGKQEEVQQQEEPVVDKKKKKSGDKEEYDLRKDMSVEYTKILLERTKDDKMLTFLNGNKKLDDLCDSFLQGYHYLYVKMDK